MKNQNIDKIKEKPYQQSDSEKSERSKSCERSREKKRSRALQKVEESKKEKNLMLKKESKEENSDIDMFGDDYDDEKQKADIQKKNSQLTDEAGYYIPIIGQIIGDKYKIVEKLGKGVFGIVVKAENIKQGNSLYAIKIIRKNQMTQVSGLRQYKILTEIHNKHKLKRVIKVFDTFNVQGHLCIVSELLSIDLRSFSHKKQPSLADIRFYAIGMFLISNELRISKIVHADIKPDNFLFKQLIHGQKNVNQKLIVDNLKIIDFGTSLWVQEYSNFTEYQVARYYRAPEIILGTKLKKDEIYAIDVWAIGCSLFELYTNQFLFNGGSNNQMLKLMIETKGKFSNKMLNKSEFRFKHFDEEYNFFYNYYDRTTKQAKNQKIQSNTTAERDLLHLLKKYGRSQDQAKDLQNFREFLERCLMLNPKDRLTPQQAMEHPFLHYQTKLQT